MTPQTPPPLPYVLTSRLVPVRNPIEGVLVGGLTLVLALAYGLWLGPRAAVVVIVVLAAVFVAATVLAARRRLVIHHEGIEHRNTRGLTTRTGFADIESVAFFERFDGGPRGVRPRFIIARRSGEPIPIDHDYLGSEGPHPALLALSAKGVPVHQYPAPIDYRTLARAFPRHATFIERRPWVVVAVVVPAALVIAGLVAAVLAF